MHCSLHSYLDVRSTVIVLVHIYNKVCAVRMVVSVFLRAEVHEMCCKMYIRDKCSKLEVEYQMLSLSKVRSFLKIHCKKGEETNKALT